MPVNLKDMALQNLVMAKVGALLYPTQQHLGQIVCGLKPKDKCNVT